ncbi:MAG: hypothetical protein KF830_17315 [Planctomycetes bacterium]|nr:hypothetical protein [Planctomycetota bacterium]
MGDQTERRGDGSPRGPALAILATAPRPGLVLGETCPPLRPAEAAALQTAWLKQIAQEWPGATVHLCGGPIDALPMLRYFAGPGVELRPWADAEGTPPGFAAMARVVAELAAEGYGPVLARSADTPDASRSGIEASLAAAAAGHTVLGRDQRGEPWLCAAPDGTAVAAPAGRGPWARRVQNGDDLALWLHERDPDRATPPTLPVRDLQASLRFYELVFGTDLEARDERTATLACRWFRLRLTERGPAFAPNGLRLRCGDPAALGAVLAAHAAVRPGDEIAAWVGGGTGLTATDDNGNRLTFLDAGIVP